MDLKYTDLDFVVEFAKNLLEFGAPGSSITLRKSDDERFEIEQVIEVCYDTPDTGFVKTPKKE
jgi:hypothetical protein